MDTGNHYLDHRGNSPSVTSDGRSSMVSTLPNYPKIAKTSPHAGLTLTNHASSNMPTSTSMENSDSAQSLLRDVHNESEMERNGRSKRKNRSIGPLGGGAGKDVKLIHRTNSKHYARMGLIIDSPTKENRDIFSQGPRITSKDVSVSGGVTSDGVGGNFEVLAVDSEGGCVQSSPPISMKSESLGGSGGDGDEPASSPDSGYGNTPDNPGKDDHHIVLQTSSITARTRARAIIGDSTQYSAYSIDSSPNINGHPFSKLTSASSVPNSLVAQVNSKIEHSSTLTTAPNSLKRVEGSMDQHQDSGMVSASLSSAGDLEKRSYHGMFDRVQQPSHSSSFKYSMSSSVRRGRFSSRNHLRHEVLRPSKSFSALSSDEKDYFQVTDELSQENTHFSLSEALLVVIEQYKASLLDQHHGMEELSLCPSTAITSSSLPYSYPLPDSPSTGYLSSWSSTSSIATNDDVMMSRISLLELMQPQSCDHSAEYTAQKLLQHMAGHMTGTFGDNLNMTQLALKLPTDFLISLQTDEDLKKSVITSSAHMRGSKEWAPPRKQIIYHVKLPAKNLQSELSAQGHRCTGCGMKVDSAHSRYFRFCNYVGKYFCQNCHSNATHIIPAHILQTWSFKKLPVSNFARDLLTKIHDDPVFSVNPTQHAIYKKVPVMAQVKEVRSQLVSIRQYLRTCRQANRLNQAFERASPWTTDLSSFSLSDFLGLKTGVKLKQLKTLLVDAVSHVKSCPICQGRGFVCEFCNKSDDIIFPFEANKVSICRDCRCCFHKQCYDNSSSCPRCVRMKERQRYRVQKLFAEEVDDDEGGEEPPG